MLMPRNPEPPVIKTFLLMPRLLFKKTGQSETAAGLLQCNSTRSLFEGFAYFSATEGVLCSETGGFGS
jgi:hypothetical protein